MVRVLTMTVLTGSLLLTAIGCSPVDPYEETTDYAVLGTVDSMDVPPVCSRDTIRVYLRGTIGSTSAHRFDRINSTRQDSLIVIAVWGRLTQKTGDIVVDAHVGFDTTLILRSTKVGRHYIDVLVPQGTKRDSTLVQ
jgi:hypothetical protein